MITMLNRGLSFKKLIQKGVYLLEKLNIRLEIILVRNEKYQMSLNNTFVS